LQIVASGKVKSPLSITICEVEGRALTARH
jgi:hypothetical protein